MVFIVFIRWQPIQRAFPIGRILPNLPDQEPFGFYRCDFQRYVIIITLPTCSDWHGFPESCPMVLETCGILHTYPTHGRNRMGESGDNRIPWFWPISDWRIYRTFRTDFQSDFGLFLKSMLWTVPGYQRLPGVTPGHSWMFLRFFSDFQADFHDPQISAHDWT